MAVHNFLDGGSVRTHQQILHRHHAFQMASCIHYVAGIDRLLVYSVFPNICKGFLHCHSLFQSHIFGSHHASSTVVRILEKLVNQLSCIRAGIFQHSFYNRRRKLLQHIHRIIHKQIVHDVLKLIISNTGNDMLLLLHRKAGEHI